MSKRKATLIALTSAATLATGCFFATSLASRSDLELMGAKAILRVAELNTSANIIKATNSDYVFGFQLHGGENYGKLSQKKAGSIEVYDEGDYVMSLRTNADYIQFFLNESDSGSYKVSPSEYKTFYALPGLKSITVTVDKETTGLSLYAWSGAQSCFDYSESEDGEVRKHTLSRNSTPLPSGGSYGNRILIENETGKDEPVKIRSILFLYSC